MQKTVYSHDQLDWAIQSENTDQVPGAGEGLFLIALAVRQANYLRRPIQVWYENLQENWAMMKMQNRTIFTQERMLILHNLEENTRRTEFFYGGEV